MITRCLFLRTKGKCWAAFNSIQNFQNKSVISVLVFLKSYRQTQFELNLETFGIFEKVAFGLFSFSQHMYFSCCSDVISVGRDPLLENEINVHSYAHYTLLFRSNVRET